MKVNSKTYMSKVINALGVQAARKMKSKRGLVSISELVSGLQAFRSQAEVSQLKSSLNYLIQNNLVNLVLPGAVKKTLNEVGLCCSNPCCDPCCRPRLSVGVVYGNDGLPVNQLGGDCCGSCRPRLSIGVVYPQETAGMNQFAAGKMDGMGMFGGVNQNNPFGANQMKQGMNQCYRNHPVQSPVQVPTPQQRRCVP